MTNEKKEDIQFYLDNFTKEQLAKMVSDSHEQIIKLQQQVKKCSIPDVSQQRELLIATIEKVRYNLDGYGALTSSEIAERLEKAINCG